MNNKADTSSIINKNSVSLNFRSPHIYAIICRSFAVFIILYQLRLIAGELADTGIFTVTLTAGFVCSVFLYLLNFKTKKVSHFAALLTVAVIPWVSRAFIALPRIFISGRTDYPAIILDSALLNLDRNNFVSLFPYYWSAVSTWFSFFSAKFLRAMIVTDIVLLLFMFSAANASEIALYNWPVVMIIVFMAIVFFQVLALLFSIPRETKLRIKEIAAAAVILLIIVIAGGFLFLKPLQERAAEFGGGLLEPKLFSFDFSKQLKLDPEISVKKDLVLIVKREDDFNDLLRRSVLSGYNKKLGFFEIEGLDNKTHPQQIPQISQGSQGVIYFDVPENDYSFNVLQEYFLVNIDSSAFIAVKEPISVTPYENWNSSSFKSVYAVESIVNYTDYYELLDVTLNEENSVLKELGLSDYEYKIYTEYGNDVRIKKLAEEVTIESKLYGEKVFAIYNYLKFGDYRYSFKPGIATDGDQLGWFLFNSKKGYCTYYAFSFTLLLRSLGIPARVATGFLVEKGTNAFDYYPVLSDQAHAWVEVAFPEYGWVEIDPTTLQIAEGEEYMFMNRSSAEGNIHFEKLLMEIIDNRSGIKIKEGINDKTRNFNFDRIINIIKTFLVKNGLLLFSAFWILLVFSIRYGIYISVFLTKNFRKSSIRLMNHAIRRLQLAGYHCSGTAKSEWAQNTENKFAGIYPLYLNAASAMFSQNYSKDEYNDQHKNYKSFCISYRKNVSLFRRIISFVLAPVMKMTLFKAKKITMIALITIFMFVPVLDAQDYESGKLTDEDKLIDADELYNNAYESNNYGNWDRAIELFKEGLFRFPNDSRFPLSLGDLYFNQSLYNLAWNEYQKTIAMTPDDIDVLFRLAWTAGNLNMDAASARYYELILEHDENNNEAISSLGWMYFKTHRLEEGAKLLLSAIDMFGEDMEFTMTLGTIYLDMYRYEDSKYWYKKTIANGMNNDDSYFTSVVWYNLSILESQFYHYDLCMEAVKESLKLQDDRATGHLALGELYMRRMELEKTLKEYETAYNKDNFPYAKLSLAGIYQILGRLDEARVYAEDCLRDKDTSWMVNFGIDPIRYKRDIHETLSDIYTGLTNIERLSPKANLKERINSLYKIIEFKLKGAVHKKLYYKYCLMTANEYRRAIFGNDNFAFLDNGKNNSLIELYTQYYYAVYSYPRRAGSYLEKRRAIVTDLIPASIPSFDLRRGLLFDDNNYVENALYNFDEFWQKDLIADCYDYFASKNNDKAAEELFIINRGAVRQAGIRLPVNLEIDSDINKKQTVKYLKKALETSGFKLNSQGARFTLSIKSADNVTYNCSLFDNTGERKVDTLFYSLPVYDTKKYGIYDFVRTLAAKIFS